MFSLITNLLQYMIMVLNALANLDTLDLQKVTIYQERLTGMYKGKLLQLISVF